MKARVPDLKMFAAEPEGFDDTLRSFKSGQRERNTRMSGTICDALMTDPPRVINSALNTKLVGQGVVAHAAQVGRAVAYAFHKLKPAAESRGATGLSSMLAGKVDIKGKVV